MFLVDDCIVMVLKPQEFLRCVLCVCVLCVCVLCACVCVCVCVCMRRREVCVYKKEWDVCVRENMSLNVCEIECICVSELCVCTCMCVLVEVCALQHYYVHYVDMEDSINQIKNKCTKAHISVGPYANEMNKAHICT